MSNVRRSFLLSALDSYLGVALQLISTIVISRLLSPADIGVFAVAAVFSSLASTFRDFGVAEYMIQEKALTPEKIRAALALNVIVSWLMAACLAGLAPFASDFYGQAGLRQVMWVLALSFVFVPFGAVTMAYFRRELNYRPIVIANVASSLAAFAVSIGLALAGFGYMSLAWSTLAGIVVSVAAAMFFRPVGFPRRPSLIGIGQVFQFGKFASSVYIFGRIGKGAPELILGKTAGVADVGIFSRANGLVELLNRLLLRPVMQVCLPYFANADRESGNIVPAYTKSLMLLTGAGWPCLAAMAIAAFPAIRLIYGDQWLGAVSLAQVLCLAMAIELTSSLSREALLARGSPSSANTLQIQLVIAQVLCLLGAVPFGLVGAVWGLVLAASLGVIFSQWHLHRVIGLRVRDLVGACRNSFLLAVLTATPLLALSWTWPATESNYLVWGATALPLAGLTWVLSLQVLGHPLWVELRQLASRLLRRA